MNSRAEFNEWLSRHPGADLKNHIKINPKTSLKLVLALFGLVLLYLQIRLWTGAGSLAEINRLETEIDTQIVSNAELQKRNQSLLQDVSDLKNGLDAVEERARSELGMIKKGETFYLIVDKESGQ
jgi:cell division protein FtsB